MNERMIELANKANEEIGYTFKLEDAKQLHELMEKFAELLIRECAYACYKHKDVESFGIYPIRVAMVTKACSDNIKEHFGVEE